MKGPLGSGGNRRGALFLFVFPFFRSHCADGGAATDSRSTSVQGMSS